MNEDTSNELHWEQCPWCGAEHGLDNGEVYQRAGESHDCATCGKRMRFGYGEEYDEEEDDCYIVLTVYRERATDSANEGQ
jgi:hypothetical protein